MRPTLSNTILHLIGFAGTGKLTIGREIASLTPEFQLVDNHFVNNVIFSLIHADGKTKLPKEVWDRVGEVRAAVLRTIEELSPSDYSFVFTNQIIGGNEKHEREFERFRAVAETRGALYLPVRLLISPTELCRRITSPDREKSMKVSLEEASKRHSNS